MMNWMSLFSKNENISPEETREYIDSKPPGSFQLLDVRQPKEYEQAHIPGAILIPLGELPDRLQELNAELETIVYCRSGVRSKAGCQILTKADFPNVLNMTSGISGWQGQQSGGAEGLGLDYFIGGDFSSALSMAYAMETGLKQFYLLLSVKANSPKNTELLEYMAKLEDGHMAKLNAQHQDIAINTDTNAPVVAEGGIDVDDFLTRFGNQFKDIESILHAGMMFESQAYDMYTRLAHKESDQKLKSFYLQMATEERKHLQRLAQELDKRI
jgi:rhodanese-related sulfurtransferase